MASPKKAEIGDLAEVFGGGKSSPKAKAAPEMDEDTESTTDEEGSPEYDAAWDELEAAKGTEDEKMAFWRAVKACTGSY